MPHTAAQRRRDAATREYLGQLDQAPPEAQAAAAYRTGEVTRLNKDWQPAHRSGDTAIGETWSLMTGRIRDLCRNQGEVKNLKRALAKHVIGTGIATFADVLEAEEADDVFNFESDDLFDRWCEEEADVEGKFAWPQMQWQHFNEIPEVGESFFLKCMDDAPARTIPLCYQMLEPEQLDETQDQPAGQNQNKIIRGIEYNRRDVALAYYIYDAHPYDQYSGWTSKSSRVPADRVIHTYLPFRPSEHRGVSWFNVLAQPSRDLDWYLGNELTAAAIGALLTLVINRDRGQGKGIGINGMGGDTTGSDDNGNSLVRWGRGTVADIGKDDKVTVAESNRPNRDAGPFVKLIQGQMSMGAGVSYLRMTGDYSQSSYTSARGAHLDDQAYFIVLQAWAGRSFVLPVRRQHTIQAAAYGRFRSISARQFANRRAEMLRLVLQPPGREQLDPEKETGAATDRIRSLFSTWQDECGLRGKNWRRVALQQKRERKFFADHGLEPDLNHSAAFLARRAAALLSSEEAG